MSVKQRLPDVYFTLDILTDGSEFTGNGTIFLSVWRKPQHAKDGWLEEYMNLNAPLTRYAIAGIGDLTARLSADQRFKLSTTRAVFLPAPDCLDGLSALLLALHSAGSPSLHIVSTNSTTIEELANIVLGSRQHLRISNCQVPGGETLQNPGDLSSTSVWWQVYDDDYLVVHASRIDALELDKVTYLFSMRSRTCVSTMVVLPPQCPCVSQAYEKLLQARLPLSQDNDKPLRIDYLLAVNPVDKPWDTILDDKRITVMFTSTEGSTVADPGILIRSQKVINLLSEQLPEKFPKCFPTSTLLPTDTTESSPQRLRSCTSVMLDLTTPRPCAVMDRRKSIWERPLSDESTSTVTSLQNFPDSNHVRSKQDEDENEIELDEEGSNDGSTGGTLTQSMSTLSPHLYVLGTGCATPSAIRGASGYALSFPSNDKAVQSKIFLLDCGEGMATMLSRYGPDDWLRCIRGIWISHAHLDHYGGLSTVLRAMANEPAGDGQFKADQSTTGSHEGSTKRHKKGITCCWVMAPPKVLRYIDLCLGCHHGRRKSDGRRLFDPWLNHDPTIPPGPWTHFENIRVLHNCHPAHGLLLGWRCKQEEHDSLTKGSKCETAWFCFSGDTRPSDSLIRACQRVAPPMASRPFFLLHEATFEDTECEQAERKKHSTVCEALEVARKVGASRVLLTHFSQRYVSLQALTTAESTSQSTAVPVGLAMDGLCVPLE